MTNCCNEWGMCTRGKDCPARESSQAKGRVDVAIWVKTANKTMPKVDEPPLGYFEDFLEYAKTVLLPWTVGIALGAAFTAFCFVFGWSLGI